MPKFSKNYWKCEQKPSNVHKILNLDKSLQNTKIETEYLMIPLTILYDEYIGRPKLTEQKKTQLGI